MADGPADRADGAGAAVDLDLDHCGAERVDALRQRHAAPAHDVVRRRERGRPARRSQPKAFGGGLQHRDRALVRQVAQAELEGVEAGGGGQARR